MSDTDRNEIQKLSDTGKLPNIVTPPTEKELNSCDSVTRFNTQANSAMLVILTKIQAEWDLYKPRINALELAVSDINTRNALEKGISRAIVIFATIVTFIQTFNPFTIHWK